MPHPVSSKAQASLVLACLGALEALATCRPTPPRSEPAGETPLASTDYEPKIPPALGALAGYEAHFILRWNGARVGDAGETVERRGNGLRYHREEHLSVRRGDDIVPMVTRLTIDTDARLRAERVHISQISGPEQIAGRAVRAPEGGPWRATYDQEPERVLPEDAIPVELVPLLLLADQRAHNRGDVVFRGRVLLAGYGFAVGRMEVVAEDAREYAVALVGETGEGTPVAMRTRWRTTRYGSLTSVHGEHGVSAERAHPSELTVPFVAPEVVDSSSIALRGAAPGEPTPRALVLESVAGEPPPDLPGQQVDAHAGSWTVRLGPGDWMAPPAPEFLDEKPDIRTNGPATRPRIGPKIRPDATDEPGDRDWRALSADIVARAHARGARQEVVALARATDALIEDDLGAPVSHAHAALTLGRGDCTAHATVFYALARARGIPVMLVTGYRVDRDRLVRHRWAVAAVDGAWMAVDPAHGQAPAAPGLIGLARHGASSADIALVDETAFAGLNRASARVLYRDPDDILPAAPRSRQVP